MTHPVVYSFIGSYKFFKKKKKAISYGGGGFGCSVQRNFVSLVFVDRPFVDSYRISNEIERIHQPPPPEVWKVSYSGHVITWSGL